MNNTIKDDVFVDIRGEIDYDIRHGNFENDDSARQQQIQVVVRQTNKIMGECEVAHVIRHALATLDAQEHYSLLVEIFNSD